MDPKEQEVLFNLVRRSVEKYVTKFGMKDYEDNKQTALMEVWKFLSYFDPKHPNANVELWAIRAANSAVRASYRKNHRLSPIMQLRVRELKKLEEKLHNENRYSLETLEKESGLTHEVFVSAHQNFYSEPKNLELLVEASEVDYTEDLSINLSIALKKDSDTSFPVTDPYEINPLRDLMEELMEKLPEPQRKVIYLMEYKGLTMEEIRDLDPEKPLIHTLYSRRRRGLKKLKELLYAKAGIIGGEEGCGRTDKQVLQAIL